jgi:2',3'-cyclic-nucleotide 2'-phosphodiesterase (5'-nucleotidase family)
MPESDLSENSDMNKLGILFFLLFIFTSINYGQENVRDVTIFHWNDFHARNLPYKVSKKVKGEETEYFVGGTAGLLAYLNKFRNSSSLVVNGGDDYQGTPISSITKGFSQIHLLNLYNLDAFVLGNHEFDYGQYALDSALQGAKFDYLSANVFFKPKNSTMGKPYVIKEINGVKIGIIGLTALELPEVVLPGGISEIRMLNADSVVTAGIAKLKEERCDMIMLLTHIGVDVDKEMARKYYTDVDVIVGGHSHTSLKKPAIQNGVIIVQAGSLGRYLGKLDLQIDTDRDTVIFYSGELIETVLDSSIMDMNAQREVEDMLSDIEDELNEVIGVLETPWERQAVRESNLGQWEADAIRKRIGTDIAFMNSGGLRADLLAGDITVNDIWTINPFGNTIVTMEVSGLVLKEMLTNAFRKNYLEMKEGSRPDLVITSGLGIEFDSEKIPAGNDEILVSVKVNGEPLQESRTYTIATNNYVGEQFEKFFGTVTQKPEIEDTNILDRDLLIDAVKEQKVINSIRENRIINISNSTKEQ